MRKLSVFLSSAMTGELNEERTSIKVLFRSNINLGRFFDLYVVEDHASPSEIEKAYVKEVLDSDVLILLLSTELRQPVVREFEAALQESLKVFCYIKKGVLPSDELSEFIKTKAYSVHCGLFFDAVELTEKVESDLLDDLIRSYTDSIDSRRDPQRKDYSTGVSTAPNSEYRFFPVDYLIDVSRREEIARLDKDQLISLAILLQEQQGDYRSALLLYEVGLLRFPDDWMLHNNRGTVLDAMGLLEASLFSYKKVIQLKPESHTAYYNTANNLLDLGRNKEAIHYYEQSLQLEPNKVVAINRLATCYLREGMYEQALEWSRKAVTLSNDVVVKANNALILSANSQYEKALAACEEIKSNAYYYHYVHSQILYKLGDYQNALQEIESVLEAGALDYELAIKKFYCLSALKRINDAKEWIKMIEKRYPFRAEDYNNIGYHLMNTFKMRVEAVELFRKAIDLNPQLMVTWNNLQACLGEMEKFEEGLQACDDALATNSFDKKSILNRNTFLTALGRFDEGIGFVFDKTLELFGTDTGASRFQEYFKAALEKSGLDIQNVNRLFKEWFLLQKKLDENKAQQGSDLQK
jgi:tetratricopeptide (TPR) repeat protein